MGVAERRLPRLCPSKPAGAHRVVPMRGVKSKIENMGPRGSLLQAPAGGLGADFKTTLFWGGPNGPLGPNASNASMGEPS